MDARGDDVKFRAKALAHRDEPSAGIIGAGLHPNHRGSLANHVNQFLQGRVRELGKNVAEQQQSSGRGLGNPLLKLREELEGGLSREVAGQVGAVPHRQPSGEGLRISPKDAPMRDPAAAPPIEDLRLRRRPAAGLQRVQDIVPFPPDALSEGLVVGIQIRGRSPVVIQSGRAAEKTFPEAVQALPVDLFPGF